MSVFYTTYAKEIFSFWKRKCLLLFILLCWLMGNNTVFAQQNRLLKADTLYMCHSHLLPLNLNSAVGVAIPAGSGKWYNSYTGEVCSNIIVPTGDRDSLNYHFIVGADEALCELQLNDRYNVSVIIEDIPAPSGETEQLFCYTANEVPALRDLVVEGEDIRWYLNEKGGEPLDMQTPLKTESIYYAASVKTGCGESTERLGVRVILEIQPDISVEDPGIQASEYNLNQLVIIDTNNAEGSITFHSEVPLYAFDMSKQLSNEIITQTQEVYVMKATAGGCFDVEQIQITINACNFEVEAEIMDVACFGDSTGWITLEITGNEDNTTGFTYLWNDGGTGASIANLPAGTYSVNIVPDNGCDTIVRHFEIFQPDPLELVLQAVGESAPNRGDGKITAVVSGGTPSYSYQWNDLLQQQTPTAINLEGGEYKVVVQDQNGCLIEGTAKLEDLLFIPEGFSPNEDNINDRFIISGLEKYPEARLEVYNRWNNLVYSKDGYGNETRWGVTDAWWDGRSTGKRTIGNDYLPAATYIYILQLRPDQPDVHKGIIFLNR